MTFLGSKEFNKHGYGTLFNDKRGFSIYKESTLSKKLFVVFEKNHY